METERWDNSLQAWERIWASPEWALATRFLSIRRDKAVAAVLSADPHTDPTQLARSQGHVQVLEEFLNGNFREFFTAYMKETTE